MAVAPLLQALSKGGKVVWEPPDKPRLRVPLGMSALLREDLGTVREVLRRAVAFKKQISEPGPVPLLVLPEGKGREGGCISCGGEVLPSEFRCPLCQAAAWIALGLTPPPVREDA